MGSDGVAGAVAAVVGLDEAAVPRAGWWLVVMVQFSLNDTILFSVGVLCSFDFTSR